MTVFLDNNIILDLLLERDGYEDSALLFQWQDEGRLRICVSFLTMVNAAYIYKKSVGQEMAVINLKYLSSLVKVLPMDEEQLQQAILLESKDFEDTLQAVCAAKAQCDYLITRNERDFKISKGLAKQITLPTVLSPASFVRLFSLSKK